MTNEEAFEKWYEIHGNGSSYYRDRLVWNAAIAYMQEQDKLAEQSEPVATIYNGIAYWIGKEPPEGTNLYTSAQPKEWVAPNNEVIDTLWSKATHESVAHNEPFTRYRFTEMLIKQLNTKG